MIDYITGGFVKHMDLTVPQTFNKTYDWVMSISVGEFLPRELDQVYVDNVARAASEGIVISWGYKLSPANYWFNNERSPEEVTQMVKARGFKLHKDWSLMLRLSSELMWYRRALLVFYRQGYPQIAGRIPASEEL
jgi:hypothetical protein